MAVNCKTDFENETKSTDDTESSDNINKLNESGNDAGQSQVGKGDNEENEEGKRSSKAEVCTENVHKEASAEDKDKNKTEDMEVPVHGLTDEKNTLLNRPSQEKKGDNDYEQERNRIMKTGPCTQHVHKEASTEDKCNQNTEDMEVPVQGRTEEEALLLNRPAQVKKEGHDKKEEKERKRILNVESCTKTLHHEAETEKKYKHKIGELEAGVKELTNDKIQLSNRPSQIKTKVEEDKQRILKAEPRSVYPHEQAKTEGEYKQKIEQLEVRVKELTEEKNKLLNRLSEIGAMKLTDNNPNVTDLSDDNRPEMLVEQFSEMYDNEWTDAYVHLTTKEGKTMELSVKLLLQILKETYDICLSSTKEKATTLRQALLSYAGLYDENSIEFELQEIEKKMSEYRTTKSKCNIARVQEEVKERFRTQSDSFQTDTSSPLAFYIDACVRICWFMCIKNPPMLLDFGEMEKSAVANDNKPVISLFDRSRFMPYTKSGDNVEYIVWPAVFAHEDGPIMRKGVAQGFHA